MTATIIHRLPIEAQALLEGHIEGKSEPDNVGAFDAGLSAKAGTPLLANRHQDYRMARRSILIGAAASLMCAPAIVRVTSLMPVRRLPERVNDFETAQCGI
jgi:hypothetical protein